jgi:hypothetical protein
MISQDGDKPGPAGLWHYVKEAFLFRWNLLFFCGAGVASLIGPRPDIFAPLTIALELLFLGSLTGLPRFRSAIDAKVHAEKSPARGISVQAPNRALADLLFGLDKPARSRFEDLRDRCLDMQQLARGVRAQTTDTSGADEIRAPALDRLLWTFLKLLYSQCALRGFLSATNENDLKKKLDELKAKQAKAAEKKDERILRSLVDAVATAELRLDNFRKAVSNAEFVGVELDRIEGKIQALTEMGVSHQDPDFLSSQVDAVAESMTHTETAIRELNQITGLSDQMENAPPILNASFSK